MQTLLGPQDKTKDLKVVRGVIMQPLLMLSKGTSSRHTRDRTTLYDI